MPAAPQAPRSWSRGNLLPLARRAEGGHTARISSPQWSFAVATITEIPPVIFLPNFLVQRKVLRPLRTQTGGTIMVGGE